MKESYETTKTSVVLHPLCLLSVTDHYNRVAKDTRKRVVGVLLGSRNGDEVDVANSYGVPFEEDLKNSRYVLGLNGVMYDAGKHKVSL